MNFAIWLLNKLHKSEPIKVVTDQYATATLADSLAHCILTISESKKDGIYHLSGLSCESRFEFAVQIAKKFGYDTSLISKIFSSELKQQAKRPQNSCLNCQKVIKEFGIKLLRTEEALEIMKEQVSKEAPQLIKNN